jgi:AefR-like transcriptional repressor, C-terminal domain
VLKVPDPERAAWQFLDLCQSYVFKRLIFGVVDSISREDIEASVEAGVDVFLKAYGV